MGAADWVDVGSDVRVDPALIDAAWTGRRFVYLLHESGTVIPVRLQGHEAEGDALARIERLLADTA